MPAVTRVSRQVAILLWIAWAIGFLVLVTAPFTFTRDEQIIEMKIAHLSPNIFVDTWRGGWVSVTDVSLNVLAFLPFGLLGAHALPRTAGHFRRQVLLITLLGFFVSMGVEGLQIFTRNRIPSTTDLVANSLGAWLGAWMWLRRDLTGTR